MILNRKEIKDDQLTVQEMYVTWSHHRVIFLSLFARLEIDTITNHNSAENVYFSISSSTRSRKYGSHWGLLLSEELDGNSSFSYTLVDKELMGFRRTF